MEELITVIINVYNGEKFIKKCLENIINQTYKNLEILVVNDGSTDNTLSICQEIKDNRIRIINQENKGLSLSRNVGIDNAKGEYLFFIDVDDWIDEDTIEYLYKLCKENNAEMSTCRSIEVYNDKDYKKNNKINNIEKINILSQEEMLKKVLVSKESEVAIWNKLIKKELFKDVRFEKRIANDVVVTYKLVINAKNIVFSNFIKYYYFKHNTSITFKNKPDRAIDLYKATLERYEYVKKIYPNMMENNVGVFIRGMYTFFNEKEEVQEYWKKNKCLKQLRSLFDFRIYFSKIGIGLKVKITLFLIAPKLYRKIRKKHYCKKEKQLI